MKTNAARLLDTLGINYELREYQVDPEDLSAEIRGTQLLMSPADYLKVTKCKVGPISRPKV